MGGAHRTVTPPWGRCDVTSYLGRCGWGARFGVWGFFLGHHQHLPGVGLPRPPPPVPLRGFAHPQAVPGGQCDPNLQVYNVFIENLDERLPRIALFATRPIRAGEELTFDYNMHGTRSLPVLPCSPAPGLGAGPSSPRVVPPAVDPVDAESTRMDSNFGLVGGGLGGSPRARGRIECKCGAAACRKYLF